MDLLTAVMHELGHVLGYEHTDADAGDLAFMGENLAAGRRLVPTSLTVGVTGASLTPVSAWAPTSGDVVSRTITGTQRREMPAWAARPSRWPIGQAHGWASTSFLLALVLWTVAALGVASAGRSKAPRLQPLCRDI
jgi:hypothetical protein